MPSLRFLVGLVLCALACVSAVAQSSNLTTELDPDSQPRRSFQTQVSALFNAEDFRQLDQIADSARSQRQRFLGGGWKLRAFYKILRDPGSRTATDEVWNAHIQRLERWIAASPDSAAPRIALAGTYIGFAWKARGGGPGDTVTSEGLKLFYERVQKARDTLDEAKSISAIDAQWFVEMETVAMAQGWDRDKTKKLVQEAGSVEPGYFYTYDQYVSYLLPRWYGKPGEAEDFLKSISDRIGGAEGDSIYFQIATNFNCCRPIAWLPGISWDRVREGFAATEKLYGTTNQELNALAFMAVRQGDTETAQQLFGRIGENWDQDVWGGKPRFDRSKATLTLAKPLEP